MTAKYSTGLRNGLAVTGALATLLNDAELRVYAGTVPATADAAIGGATLLTTITGPADAALAWEASAVNGVLSKSASQAWEGVNAASGTAAFCRLVDKADDGTSSTSAVRIQGAVAVAGGELNLSDTALVNGETQEIDYFSIAIPTL